VIVSHRMAVEAAATLGGLDLETLSEPVLTKVYRDLAKTLHPDKGGDAAAFVAADRAKCILQGWLERRTPPEEPASAAISSATCPMCHGSGRRTLRRGFHSMTMMCGTCRGHGEMIATEKVEE
jgi:DnaJ-class molecular chaperone